MSAEKYNYWKDKLKNIDALDVLLNPVISHELDLKARKAMHDSLISPAVGYKTKYGTLGRLIEQLKEVELVVGSDVDIFIRDNDGLRSPQVVIERTPNELPVDVIVTIR